MTKKKKKKEKMKRENGKGSVYKLPGNRRNPWAVAVTLSWRDGGIDKWPEQNKKLLCTIDEEDKGIAILQRYNDLSDKLTQKGFTQEKVYEVISGIIKRTKSDWEELNRELSYDNVYSLLSPLKQLPRKTITKDTTVEELYKYIYANGEKDGVAKSTLDGWRASFKAIQYYKDRALYDLDSMDFQDVIDYLIEDPDSKSSRGKLQKIKNFVSKMYNILIQHKATTINHAQFISLRGVKEGKIPPFPESDINILFANDDNRIAKSSLILAYTGFRISEFLKLEKEKIDLDKWLIIGGSKTDAGKDRVIVIHSKIKKYIEYFYNEFPDCKYLFSKDGINTVRYEYYLEYYHRPLIEELGLSNLNPNSFRHTAASKMRIAGVEDKALTETMGHVDPKFTDKRYVDVDAEYLHREMEKVK